MEHLGDDGMLGLLAGDVAVRVEVDREQKLRQKAPGCLFTKINFIFFQFLVISCFFLSLVAVAGV